MWEINVCVSRLEIQESTDVLLRVRQVLQKEQYLWKYKVNDFIRAYVIYISILLCSSIYFRYTVYFLSNSCSVLFFQSQEATQTGRSGAHAVSPVGKASRNESDSVTTLHQPTAAYYVRVRTWIPGNVRPHCVQVHLCLWKSCRNHVFSNPNRVLQGRCIFL